MATIADSSAFKDGARVLPQHQAALTLLQARLSVPDLTQMGWLDLACGRGQIIVSIDDNISEEARRKIVYWAYDVDHDYARETTRTAGRMGFASIESKIGDLSDFDRLLPTTLLFDFITLTNTIHEIEPGKLAQLLVHCLRRLSPTGTLFVYDMEHILPPELGAVPWSRNEVRQIVRCMLDALGARTAYNPEVGQWHHKTTNGWNVQIQREHLGLSDDELSSRASDAILATSTEVARLLDLRLKGCTASLQALTQYGAETSAEQEEKERLLYEFWALSRALTTGP